MALSGDLAGLVAMICLDKYSLLNNYNKMADNYLQPVCPLFGGWTLQNKA